MKAGIKIEGLGELDDKLRRASAAYSARDIEKVLLGGARTIRDDWKGAAPVGEHGSFGRGIKAAIGRRANALVGSAFAAIDRKIVPHASLVLGGTKPHSLRPKDKKALAIAGLARASAQHPGAEANPFTDRELDRISEDVMNQVQEGLGKLLDDIAK